MLSLLAGLTASPRKALFVKLFACDLALESSESAGVFPPFVFHLVCSLV